MTQVDRWRLVAAVLAGLCILLSLRLWAFGAQLDELSRGRLTAVDGCPLSLDDLEHS